MLAENLLLDEVAERHTRRYLFGEKLVKHTIIVGVEKGAIYEVTHQLAVHEGNCIEATGLTTAAIRLVVLLTPVEPLVDQALIL